MAWERRGGSLSPDWLRGGEGEEEVKRVTPGDEGSPLHALLTCRLCGRSFSRLVQDQVAEEVAPLLTRGDGGDVNFAVLLPEQSLNLRRRVTDHTPGAFTCLS